MLRRSFLFLGALAVLTFAVGPALAVQYTITDLGTHAGTGSSRAYGINNSGQVTGYAKDSSGADFAFLWDNGTMTNLGTIGSYSTTQGYSVNDAGTVVGYATYPQVATIWDSTNGMQYLFSGSTDTQSCANAINNNAIAVGQMQVTVGSVSQQRAFSYDIGTSSVTDLGGLSFLASLPMSTSEDVNNNNQVVGWGLDYVFGYKPFLYSGGSLTDLSTVITGAKKAIDINDNGWIVGEGNAANFASEAFLYNGTTSIDLGQLQPTATVPLSLNNNGLVVGYSGGYSTSAFLYDSATATLSDLYSLLDTADQSVWSSLSRAYDVNDAGQIVGYGKLSTGEYRGFLMTPVPEPSTIVLSALGLVGLLCYAWRKQK